MQRTMTREEWLMKFVEEFRPEFISAGHTIPEKLHVTCGWPSKSALSRKNRRIGEAWPESCSVDKYHEIFISPCLSDLIEVGATLIHELVHTAVGCKHGHKTPFKRAAVAIGLEGKMTATHAGEALVERIKETGKRIGEYPHSTLDFSAFAKKQTTRLLKISCPSCGYTCRTTAKWLEVGVPTCVCGTDMEQEDK